MKRLILLAIAVVLFLYNLNGYNGGSPLTGSNNAPLTGGKY